MKHFMPFMIIAVLGLITVNTIISCSPKRHNPTIKPTQQTSDDSIKTTVGSPLIMEGTSDSGGGTGVDGKIFESYIIDPTELPPYQQDLKNRLKNINFHSKDPILWESLLKHKTWYLVPSPLQRIRKSVLGVSFLEADTHQIARQSMKEVWISKPLFEQMSLLEQSKLLLHELVMAMYMLKFSSLVDLCEQGLMLGDKSEMVVNCKDRSFLDLVDHIESIHPPVEPRQLTSEDNENIRYVTGWLWQNLTTGIEITKLYRILSSRGFDQRIFNPANYADEKILNTSINLPADDLFEFIHAAEISGSMPNTCMSIDGEYKVPCNVKLEKSRAIIPGISNAIKLIVHLPNETNPLIVLQPLGEEYPIVRTTFNDETLDYVSFSFSSWKESFQVGDRFHNVTLHFKEEKHNGHLFMSLESIVIVPGVIYSIDIDRDPICLGTRLKGNSLSDKLIVIKKSGTLLNELERAFRFVEPAIFCAEGSVQTSD
jgi:hypothetical protein